MSLIWLFEHTKTGCMVLHHATVIAERWVGGEGEIGGWGGSASRWTSCTYPGPLLLQ